MAIAADGIAPYGSPQAILAVIEHAREKGFRDVIDISVLMRASLANSTASAQRTIQTLRILDLIDEDGKPSDALNGIAQASEEDYRARMEEAIRSAYAPVFEVAEPTDGYTKVRDAFRKNVPQAQQKRMVTLFLNLCEAAGMVDSIPQGKAPGPTPARKSVPKTPKAQSQRHVHIDTGKEPHAGEWASQYPALAGLMKKLPLSSGWTQDQQDRWLDAFKTVLSYEIEVIMNTDLQDSHAVTEEQ